MPYQPSVGRDDVFEAFLLREDLLLYLNNVKTMDEMSAPKLYNIVTYPL
jgi:hypothetical protein